MSTPKCICLRVNAWLRRTSSMLITLLGWGVNLNRVADVPRKKNGIEIDQETRRSSLFQSAFALIRVAIFSISWVVDFLPLLFSHFCDFFGLSLSFSFFVFVSPSLYVSFFFVFCLFFFLWFVWKVKPASTPLCPFNASKSLFPISIFFPFLYN